MAVQKLVTKLTRTRVTVGNYIGTLTHPIYLGMPPLPLTIGGMPLKGGGDAVTPTLSGISVNSVKARTKQTGSKGGGQVNFGSDIPTNQSSNTRRKTRLPGKPRSARLRSGVGVSKTRKSATSSSKTKTILLKNGRKVFMRNGKFVKGGK